MEAQRLKQLRSEKHVTQDDVATFLGITRPAYTAYESGNREPDDKTKVKLANYFGVSVDYLVGNSNRKHYYDLTEKNKKDIGLEVEEVLSGMTGGINFYGEPMTDEGREKLKASLEMALELSKREAKKKFTPKKYRDK